MGIQYHFLCRPVENIKSFESELNRLIDDGWRVKGDIVPRIIKADSKGPDELFVTLTKESARMERTDRS